MQWKRSLTFQTFLICLLTSLLFLEMSVFFGTLKGRATQKFKQIYSDMNSNSNNQNLQEDVGPASNDSRGYISGVYYTNWSPYAPRNHFPHDMNLHRITNVFYSFFVVDPKSGTVKSSDEWSDFQMDLYKKFYPQFKAALLSSSSSSTFQSHKKEMLPMGCIGELFYLKYSSILPSLHGDGVHRNFKVSMSVGGWSNRDAFPIIVRDKNKFGTFIRTCVETMFQYGFDGLDIDWEFPQNDGLEPKMYLTMIRRLREALDDLERDIFQDEHHSEHFLLTVAVPAFKEKLQVLPLRDMDAYVDFWNLMAYDYHGEWSELTGYHSNLYSEDSNHVHKRHFRDEENQLNADSAVKYLLKNFGINSRKVVLGMAAYGRGFTRVKASANSGNYIGKPYNGVGGASEGEPGMWLYNQLPLPGTLEDFDPKSVSAYSFDPKSKTFVGYDNVDSMRCKAQYVKNHNLAGGFWWESCGDNHKDEQKSLLNAFTNDLGSLTKQQPSIYTSAHVIRYYLKNYPQGFLSRVFKG